MDYDGLKILFATHVVEVVARRRRPVPNMSIMRGFLCTNSRPLLNSIPGKSALHFKAPKGRPAYNARSKNLITVWDLFRQDWRNINLDAYKVFPVMSVRNKEEIEYFWAYFAAVLAKLSSRDKIDFMNR